MTKKRAFFSAPDHPDILIFAGTLRRLGWELVVTPNLVNVLKDAEIPGENIAEFAGTEDSYPFPPTMHPKVEAALTLDQTPARIDLVYNITYSLDVGNDVGGHTLLALGIKGNRIVVYNVNDMKRVISALEREAGHFSIPGDLKSELTDKALFKITKHYITIGQMQGNGSFDGMIGFSKLMLENGENPYQQPSELFQTDDDALSLHKFQHMTSSVPCFTNMADTDAILQTLCLCAEAFRVQFSRAPFIAVAAKHGNPCGMATDWNSPGKCLRNALFGNPSAVWGGECIVNFPITGELAEILLRSSERGEKLGSPNWMLDIIAGPDFDQEGVRILGKSNQRKLLKNSALSQPFLSKRTWNYRQVRGGILRQPPGHYVLDIKSLLNNSQPPDDRFIESVIIAWSVAFTSFHGGNEIAVVNDNQLIGAGGGPSTVDAAHVAIMRAKNNKHPVENSVFAADAFFPFTDAPEVLQKAGCSGGIVPCGGKNDTLVKTFFTDCAMRVLYLSSEIRGFCRH